MQIEILALRHQLAALQRRTNKRARLSTADRLLWVILSRLWGQWRSALAIVKPETVIAWQRKGVSLVLALEKGAPEPRAIQPREAGIVVELPQVGGLHHRYERRAA